MLKMSSNIFKMLNKKSIFFWSQWKYCQGKGKSELLSQLVQQKKKKKLRPELLPIFPLFPCDFLLCHSPSLPVLVRSINIAPFRAEARWPSAEPSATRCSTLANRWPARVLAPTAQLTANDRLRRQQHHPNEHGPVWLLLVGEKKISHTHTQKERLTTKPCSWTTKPI